MLKIGETPIEFETGDERQTYGHVVTMGIIF